MIFRLSLTLCLLAGIARADVPRVATDIAPIRSLAATVMDGLGDPSQIVRPGASPHGYAMRPSEASALQDADIVFWIGPELTPWLGDVIGTLAPGAALVPLLDLPDTNAVPFRTGDGFGGHDHPGRDPHAWLDPENGKAWLTAIAAELARLDPPNADAYAANARQGIARIEQAETDIAATLAAAKDMRFVVFHDAYRYFEDRFGLAASGAIALGDAASPGPARIERIRDAIADLGVACVFSEPQFNPALVRTVTEGTGARPAVLDPLGTGIAPGPAFYPALLRELADGLAACGGN
ncbi:hypothetical protein OCGS_1410 [Oceaniovalibus guishaninsula JLT2003]|uniref:High-affinity zinc uptake system protein ZnuA n=1 Tax=Oceaniovalibus guishaninsula JLT2003 TaxID=1231392 RepID=K2HDF0_9RHOB|nr:zinc ABC transporter substrate-binding protein [Oceaniovalibus guishaninsula]EKE44572.1 hypothetical protein OCGS_1410 [Oceaniovalibus guishaninsula JLT2003]